MSIIIFHNFHFFQLRKATPVFGIKILFVQPCNASVHVMTVSLAALFNLSLCRQRPTEAQGDTRWHEPSPGK